MDYLIDTKGEFTPIKFFQDLTRIPRPSGDEKAVCDYILNFAAKEGLWAESDKIFNVFIKKDGQGKGADSPAVILQGHIDMVCEKNSDVDFNFETDALNLALDGDWLYAKGTTLGADNGVAVAYMLALLADKEIDHPPLECIFTADEERGLAGAGAVNMDMFSGTKMINLDCGPEGVFIAGCSGGARMDLEKTMAKTKTDLQGLSIFVSGLKGGHSGGDITDELGNANKILGRILLQISQEEQMQISSINGGDKDNAIPRECMAKIAVSSRDKAIEIGQKIADKIKNEYQNTDDKLKIVFETSEAGMVFSKTDSRDMINLLYILPHGPFHRDKMMDDFVINSANTASVHTEDGKMNFTISVRSSLSSLLYKLMSTVEIMGESFGMEVSRRGMYPGWAYQKNSAFRDKACEIYKNLSGKEAEVTATHGGLECGILLAKKPELDIIAIGPTTEGIHTPEERLNLPSFDRVYAFLKVLVAELA